MRSAAEAGGVKQARPVREVRPRWRVRLRRALRAGEVKEILDPDIPGMPEMPNRREAKKIPALAVCW